jgi:hypothetical protein
VRIYFDGKIFFLTEMGEDTCIYPYKDYTSLNRWQANLVLLSIIYYSVTTRLREGKKLSFLPSGDVNPGPVPLRQGLHENRPYRAVGAVHLSCDWPRPHT